VVKASVLNSDSLWERGFESYRLRVEIVLELTADFPYSAPNLLEIRCSIVESMAVNRQARNHFSKILVNCP
jgi:hypothetical protein